METDVIFENMSVFEQFLYHFFRKLEPAIISTKIYHLLKTY